MFGIDMHERTHRVSGTDTLASISQAYYGNPCYAAAIFQANRGVLENPNNIYPGQILAIPHIPHVRKW